MHTDPNPMKEGSPLLLERACPENWEVGGEEKIRSASLKITLQLSGKRTPLSFWREPVLKIGRSGERSKSQNIIK